jgi:hypothetical protein
MDTIKQKKDESRKDYLLRVAIYYIDEERENIYDEAECDGSCLIDDIKMELNLE